MIALMRHGESTWNAAGRLQGADPRPPLTARGREQVAAAAELLRGRVTAITSSPALRARQSADVVAHLLGLDVTEEPLLVERGLDEAWDDVERRVRATVRADLPDGTLLVTHGDVVAYAAHLLADVRLPAPANASVLLLTPREGGSPWALDALC